MGEKRFTSAAQARSCWPRWTGRHQVRLDLKLTKAVVEMVGIPVIASGGCGSLEHFSEVFEKTGCDAALAACSVSNTVVKST